MRKHRLYGVSLAMLAASGAAVASWPSHTQNHSAAATGAQNRAARRTAVRAHLTSAHRHDATLPRGKARTRALHFLHSVHNNQVREYLTAVHNAAVWDFVTTVAAQEQAQQAGLEQAQWAADQSQQQAAPTNADPSSSSSQSSGSASTGSSGGGNLGGSFGALRQCEAGGNYSENTGNGFYGAYQFSLSTWQSLGYSGLPSDASPAQQDAAAQQLQAQDGWGPWPGCSAQLGL